MPAHNEASRIIATLGALKQFIPAERIVGVADNCSDETFRLMQNAGIHALKRHGSGGKSAAVACGMNALGSLSVDDNDAMLLCDADVADSAIELHNLCKSLREQSAQTAIAVFPSAGKAAGMGFVVRYSRNALLKHTGQHFKAPLSGQRAIQWKYARQLKAFCSYYGLEVGMSIDLHKLGACIVEVPVNMTHRHTGRNIAGFLHRAKQGYHAFRAAHGVRDISIWA
ncbi:MAG: glycosyltransferase family protein [Armatimonadota bacterium]